MSRRAEVTGCNEPFHTHTFVSGDDSFTVCVAFVARVMNDTLRGGM